jgi:hypothetical protein
MEGSRRVLGPGCWVEVVNTVSGDTRNVRSFVAAADLPASFDRLSPVAQSEAARLALLKNHGCVWMDASVILLRSLGDTYWETLADPAQEMILVEEWQRVFVAYWNDRTISTASWAHPLFQSVAFELPALRQGLPAQHPVTRRRGRSLLLDRVTDCDGIVMKFTSSMVGRLAGLTRSELLDARHTLVSAAEAAFSMAAS